MSRPLTLLLVALSTVIVSAAFAEAPIAFASHTSEPIVIDGDLSDWPETPEYWIRTVVPFYGRTDLDLPLGPNADLYATFQLAYADQDNRLYVGVEVVDERLQGSGSHHRQVDAIEIYVDGDASGERLINWFG